MLLPQLTGDALTDLSMGASRLRLGFFGGSFDPPHCGHLAIARAAAQRFSLDRVWMAPTGRQPLKRMGAEATFGDRLAMTRLLCEADDRLLASGVDAPRQDGRPNYTVDTLNEVRRQAPDALLFAIIGADALPDLPSWHEAKQLFDLATWIAVSRPGHLLSGTMSAALREEEERGRLYLVHDVDLPVSSTSIRQMLHHSSNPTREELPEAVLQYIQERRLYSEPAKTCLPSPA